MHIKLPGLRILTIPYQLTVLAVLNGFRSIRPLAGEVTVADTTRGHTVATAIIHHLFMLQYQQPAKPKGKK